MLAWLKAARWPSRFGSVRAWAKTGTDLIMGTATGYSPENILPFVESLIYVAKFGGKTVIFVSEKDHALASYLRDRGIEAAIFNPSSYPVSNLTMARWFAYQNWLLSKLEKGARFANILLTDTRDVVFQKRLFRTSCRELELHYEAPFPRIGSCPYNSTWVRRSFGEDALTSLFDERITCSGTVTGRTAGILRYLRTMTRLILTLPDDAKDIHGIDQGVHNYAAYKCLSHDAHMIENFERVATLHYVDGGTLRMGERGEIINPDGDISEIAHQWDRHALLAAAIRSKATKYARMHDAVLPRQAHDRRQGKS